MLKYPSPLNPPLLWGEGYFKLCDVIVYCYWAPPDQAHYAIKAP